MDRCTPLKAVRNTSAFWAGVIVTTSSAPYPLPSGDETAAPLRVVSVPSAPPTPCTTEIPAGSTESRSMYSSKVIEIVLAIRLAVGPATSTGGAVSATTASVPFEMPSKLRPLAPTIAPCAMFTASAPP